jgi:hypothetical protein
MKALLTLLKREYWEHPTGHWRYLYDCDVARCGSGLHRPLSC